ncbi:hypothetical protein FB567DRAFT_594282 [Paraphoma chrysanthemicola]|uniref:Uncharacterized protein n=1 Tax=Paraphoma chrysanthemicola TaxID=798071 RepID=A0A8K0VWG9_9PLEO|nr:hypothetical protein FB567DRAFT_594282 [Paraphoma chrysanthemicola]
MSSEPTLTPDSAVASSGVLIPILQEILQDTKKDIAQLKIDIRTKFERLRHRALTSVTDPLDPPPPNTAIGTPNQSSSPRQLSSAASASSSLYSQDSIASTSCCRCHAHFKILLDDHSELITDLSAQVHSLRYMLYSIKDDLRLGRYNGSVKPSQTSLQYNLPLSDEDVQFNIRQVNGRMSREPNKALFGSTLISTSNGEAASSPQSLVRVDNSTARLSSHGPRESPSDDDDHNRTRATRAISTIVQLKGGDLSFPHIKPNGATSSTATNQPSSLQAARSLRRRSAIPISKTHDPYEAGWLLGCVNDVAHCFIVAHARSSIPHGVGNPLSSAHEHAVAYLRDFGSSGGSENSVPFASLIDIDELTAVVGLIHAAHALTNWSWTTPFTPVNGESRVGAAIDGMEERFVALLYQAVINFMFEGDAERMEIALLDWGWSDARETDYELYDDGSIDSPLMQFAPDDTPTEYIAVGPKVPFDIFCLPSGSSTRGSCTGEMPS